MAHMDFPYIGDTNYFLVDVHVVNALVLALLIATHAGHVWGLDAWAVQGARDRKWLAWATA
jgi:thiosulfate dehydrogenase [quinone] large subunit